MSETFSRSQRGGSVMASNSSSAAARKSQVAVAITLQSVNNKEASMPTVNKRCKILRSLNRVYFFEIVLLLVPRLKILRRRGLSYFGIFEKQRGTVEFPRNKPQHIRPCEYP